MITRQIKRTYLFTSYIKECVYLYFKLRFQSHTSVSTVNEIANAEDVAQEEDAEMSGSGTLNIQII